MGRHLDPIREHFIKLEKPYGNWDRSYHHCRHCLEARRQDPNIEVKNLRGDAEALKKHYRECKHTPEVKERERLERLQQQQQVTQSAGPEGPPLTLKQIDDIFEKLVEMQADLRLPDSFVERPSFRLFVESVNSNAVGPLPSRRTLGGPMLEKCARKAIEEEVEAMKTLQADSGGRANFMSDGWENIRKNHLLGCQLSLFGSVTTIGLFSTEERQDGLILAEQMESIMKEAEESGWIIGAVVTDNAGQCSRARGILALRWPRVIFLKCLAHDMNNLVKSVLQSASFRIVTLQAQRVVKKLNKSHAKWLKMAKKVMEEFYGDGKDRELINLCDTRWNSMQGCFASLLRVKGALTAFATRYGDRDDFPEEFAVLKEVSFWGPLRDAEQVSIPLCFASFKLQSDENTLADAVIIFRDLYEHFSDNRYSNELVPLIENRWNACEQPLFMLALYLHPAYIADARRLKPTDISGTASICKIAEYYYKRLVGGSCNSVYGEMSDWIAGKYVKNMPDSLAAFENCSVPALPKFWQHVKADKRNGGLADLALVVLSVAVNTATCERYFSELALVHTARRNRLAVEKTRNIAAVRKSVREKTLEKVKFDPPAKRVIPSTEPRRIPAFGSPERRSSSSRDASITRSSPPVSQHEEDDGDEVQQRSREDAVAYWNSVLANLDSGNIEEQSLYSGSNTPYVAEGNALVAPDTTPFPPVDVKTFPREPLLLPGLRGRKVSLSEILSMDDGHFGLM